MKRILSLALALILLLSLFACSSGDGEKTAGEITKLSFKSAAGYDYLKTLDGSTVSISGYMATSSPVDGSFMFLMNLPYQNCPFCVPNTSQLSNTMEVYPKEGDSFGYTAQAIEVIGTLVVAENEDEPFTDMYGYEFNYKIVDASYTIIKAEDLSEDMALWQEVANSGIVDELYSMYDYLNFVTNWPEYYVNSYTDENGNTVPGYFLYASDAEKFLYTEGAQWNYGYKEGYFEDIVKKIESIDAEAFGDLIENVRGAEALAKQAISELENGNYTSEFRYVEEFGTEDQVYTLTNGAALVAEWERLYYEFADWIASWEM